MFFIYFLEKSKTLHIVTNKYKMLKKKITNGNKYIIICNPTLNVEFLLDQSHRLLTFSIKEIKLEKVGHGHTKKK